MIVMMNISMLTLLKVVYDATHDFTCILCSRDSVDGIVRLVIAIYTLV